MSSQSSKELLAAQRVWEQQSETREAPPLLTREPGDVKDTHYLFSQFEFPGHTSISFRPPGYYEYRNRETGSVIRTKGTNADRVLLTRIVEDLS